MTVDEVFAAIVATRPDPGVIVYLARSEAHYSWRAIAPGDPMLPGSGGAFPDAWMFNNMDWPVDADDATQRRFFDDMVAELETMAAGPDRCRWELDDPYGYRHS